MKKIICLALIAVFLLAGCADNANPAAFDAKNLSVLYRERTAPVHVARSSSFSELK